MTRLSSRYSNPTIWRSILICLSLFADERSEGEMRAKNARGLMLRIGEGSVFVVRRTSPGLETFRLDANTPSTGLRSAKLRVAPQQWAQWGATSRGSATSTEPGLPRASPTQPAARPAGAAEQLVPARRRRFYGVPRPPGDTHALRRRSPNSRCRCGACVSPCTGSLRAACMLSVAPRARGVRTAPNPKDAPWTPPRALSKPNPPSIS